MADRANRLPRFDEASREGDRLIDDTQVLWGAAAGDDQQVELVRRHLVERPLDLERAALLPLDGPPVSPIVTTSAPSDSRWFFGSIASESSKLFARTIATFLAISRSLIHRHDPRPSRKFAIGPPVYWPLGADPLVTATRAMQGARRVDASFPVGFRDDDARAVLAAIDPDETIAFLRELVRAPSVNPPGDVAEAAAVCERPLAEAGFSIRTLAHEPGKPNIVAEWGAGDGPALCFNAHLDVVPTGDESAWSHPPFAAEIADGRVYGRGAGDDKASVTAQVMGAIALARSGVPLRGRLVVTEVADEETSGAGALHLIAAAGSGRMASSSASRR